MKKLYFVGMPASAGEVVCICEDPVVAEATVDKLNKQGLHRPGSYSWWEGAPLIDSVDEIYFPEVLHFRQVGVEESGIAFVTQGVGVKPGGGVTL